MDLYFEGQGFQVMKIDARAKATLKTAECPDPGRHVRRRSSATEGAVS